MNHQADMNHQDDARGQETESSRQLRSWLYQLLAAAHSGPLGQELAGVIRVAAASLFEGEPLPEVPPASHAELYRQVYGLDGSLAGSAHTLPAKLTHLAWSAGRETAEGRAHEAAYIEEALLPCLGRMLARAEALEEASGYRGLLSLTRAVAQADVKHIYQLDLHHGARPYRDVKVKRMKHTSITEANIEALVHTFYARVKMHETLGPIFNPALAGRWDVHLARMVDFWSSVLLASGRYYGHPLHAHLLVQGIKPEHFRDWLKLFRETLDDLFIPAVAERIFTAASRMGERMQVVLFERPRREGYGVDLQEGASTRDSRHARGDEPFRQRSGLKETT